MEYRDVKYVGIRRHASNLLTGYIYNLQHRGKTYCSFFFSFQIHYIRRWQLYYVYSDQRDLKFLSTTPT